MKKSIHYIIVFVFATLLMAPFLNDTFGFVTFTKKKENRNFRKKPKLDISYLDPYPKAFEAYYEDHFAFRRPLLDLFHKYKFHLCKESPDPKKTIIGKEDWCFMAGGEQDIYNGLRDYSEKELGYYKTEFTRRKNYFDSLGIEFHWLIAPFKHYIYEEYLSRNFSGSKQKPRALQLKETLNALYPGMVEYPVTELKKAKEDNLLYYKMDNHWNYNGGQVASNVFLEKIKVGYPDLQIKDRKDYYWNRKKMWSGYHKRVIGILDMYEWHEIPFPKDELACDAYHFDFKPPKNFQYPKSYQSAFLKTGDTKEPRILVIMDSFGVRMMPFLKESFQESVFIFDAWKYKLNEDIVETVKPDIVLLVSLETYMDKIIEPYKLREQEQVKK